MKRVACCVLRVGAALGLALLTGCKFNSSGWPVIPFMNNGKSQRAELTTAERDTNHFAFSARAGREDFALRPAGEALIALRVAGLAPAEGCGACLTNSPIVHPAFARNYTASLVPGVGLAKGWELLMSTNLVTWQMLIKVSPGDEAVTVNVPDSRVFWRAKVL